MTTKSRRTYFEWLCKQISVPAGRTYENLFDHLNSREFVWFVPNDDNRIEDGFELRYEYYGRVNRAHACSVLEVVVALSRRVAFVTSSDEHAWAWTLIENLGLHKMTDPMSRRKYMQTEEIIDNLIWRNYHIDGSGGFFPLAWPEEDQTKVEIWYQMHAYVHEMHDHGEGV